MNDAHSSCIHSADQFFVAFHSMVISFQLIPGGFFKEYAAVKFLNLSFSKIKDVADFSLGLPYAVEINLRGNELNSLSASVFRGAENLRKIDLSSNMIAVIQPETFSTLKSLEILNLSNNQMHNNSFDEHGSFWIDSMERLRVLDLSNNRIFYSDFMPYRAFSGLVNLETLNLRRNRIKIDYGAFSSNQKLKTLDFSYNKMTYFDLNYLLSIQSLENLYLHGNGISYASQIDITDFRVIFPNIKSIGISENLFNCEVLTNIVKKADKAAIKLVIEDGKFVNDRRNLRGILCV